MALAGGKCPGEPPQGFFPHDRQRPVRPQRRNVRFRHSEIGAEGGMSGNAIAAAVPNTDGELHDFAFDRSQPTRGELHVQRDQRLKLVRRRAEHRHHVGQKADHFLDGDQGFTGGFIDGFRGIQGKS